MKRTLCLILLLSACRTDKGFLEEEENWDPVIEDQDGDGFDSEEDCNDSDSVIYPGAEELCDGIDNDCDGETDEGVSTTFYADGDGDGFGDPDVTDEACQITDGWVSTGNDCDDSDPDTYPSAAERCDGIDNDCDGEIDEDVLGSWYSDADEDGYGDADTLLQDCDPPSGYVSDDSDCNDSAPSAYPGATEICDEIDNDCDGAVDEGVTTTWYADADGDSWGAIDTTTEACTQPSGYTLIAGDCDDGSAEVSPSATEICNEIDDDCDGEIDTDATDLSTWYLDADGDSYGDPTLSISQCETPSGYVTDDSDCDDSNSSIHPAATESCNEVDDDCDGLIDDDDPDVDDASTWYIDYDSDGYGSDWMTRTTCEAPSGYTDDDSDCDDTESSIFPGADEECNELDDDCDGDIDEDIASPSTWYADADGDGFGDADSTSEACDEPSGYTDDSSDCDDDDSDVNPDADEVCNEVDDDCDGDIDNDASDLSTWYADADGDGFGDEDTDTESCDAPSDYVADDSDCDDSDSAVHPDADEICNEIDDDCDSLVDDDDPGVTDPETWYIDYDSDGYGSDWMTRSACEQPSSYVDEDSDCDDTDDAVNPDADEECNGIDDDCDGDIDEDITSSTTWYEDADGDGFGNADSSTDACDAPSGYTDDDSDCDDGDSDVNPDAEEECNDIDDDCNDTVDDGLLGLEEDCAATDCLEIIEEDSTVPDGDYWVELDGTATEVECDMSTDGGGWTLLFSDDFDSTPDSGWSISDTTTCGIWGTILGGYGVIAGGEIDITVDAYDIDHTEAWIELDYLAIDSWDNEAMYMDVDGTNIWAEAQNNHSSVYGEVCGWDRGYYGSYDSLEPVSEFISHSDTELELVVGSTLNQSAWDESFGIDNVYVWVR